MLALLIAGSVAGCDRQKEASEQAGAGQANISPGEAAHGRDPATFQHVVERGNAGKAGPIAVFSGPDDPWFQKAGLKALQPYLDPQNTLLDAANTALPTSILYDANGRELWRVVGAIDWQGEEAKALLAEGGV